MRFALRFPAAKIGDWASKYDVAVDALVEKEVGPAAKARGYLKGDEFLALARWKTPRSQPRCEKNDAAYVEEVTGRALQSKNDRFKIESLCLLNGVAWPTASVILHFCDEGRHPILDARALWSLGMTNAPAYDYALWSAYADLTRNVAARAGVSMRTLDRALWQYSKERQRA